MHRVLLIALVACGGAPKPELEETPTGPVFGKRGEKPPKKKHESAEELERPATPKLLDIDWSTVKLASTADANALWARIAPTGLDWEEKLDELPSAVERPLAIALIEGGNFQCMPVPAKKDCVAPVFDVKEPAQSAGFGDPCLRRLIALWALDKLEGSDVRRMMPALKAMVAIPPPESELVAAVLAAVPEDAHAQRLELIAAAMKGGQHEVVIGKGGVGRLDESHLIEAATKFHVDGAVEILSAEGHRAVYLAAVADEQMMAKTRTSAMLDLVALDPSTMAADVKAALVKAAASKDCTVAATAARMLEQAGDARFVPRRPKAARTSDVMRALCVLASYEQQQRADETSLLAGYVPKKGLEKLTVTYDPLGETDDDGDGDPHTARRMDLVMKDELAVPEVDDVVKAFRNCIGTTCRSEDREVRFVLKPVGGQLLLTRMEIVERPPCPKP